MAMLRNHFETTLQKHCITQTSELLRSSCQTEIHLETTLQHEYSKLIVMRYNISFTYCQYFRSKTFRFQLWFRLLAASAWQRYENCGNM